MPVTLRGLKVKDFSNTRRAKKFPFYLLEISSFEFPFFFMLRNRQHNHLHANIFGITLMPKYYSIHVIMI